MNSVDDFRKDAKRWLKRLREHNPEALTRLKRAYPGAGDPPTLRDVQHALAREQGYDSWLVLKQGIETSRPDWWRVGLLENDATRVAKLLDLACWDHRTHGRIDFAAREAAAVTLLRKYPELARNDLYTAIVCGDLEDVQRIIDTHPDAVHKKGGSRRWEPLLYLTYARLSQFAPNAIRMATLLLDRGADPNAYYMAGDAFYSALVGIPGEGEQDAPPHAERDALYLLLLERGANPFDIQVLYNTHFTGDVLWWLELTHRHTMRTARRTAWDDPNWPMFDMGGYGCGARFLFRIAIEKNDLALARWLLEHGANPNAPPAPHPKWPKRSLYEDAVASGRLEISDLLRQHGATHRLDALGDEDLYVAACLRVDRAAAIERLRRHPEFASSPKALFEAARVDHGEAVALLLDLGTPVDASGEDGETALHIAAAHNATRAIAVLLAHGADPDVRERRWNAVPLGFAAHHGRDAAIDLLVPVSTNVWSLTYLGRVDRLREVLASAPQLARETTARGVTPLFWLPADDERAAAVVDLLLAHGADPAIQSAEGRTAEGIARERGLDGAAATLAAACNGTSSRGRI